jgi:CheY-like chemotaxis protein
VLHSRSIDADNDSVENRMTVSMLVTRLYAPTRLDWMIVNNVGGAFEKRASMMRIDYSDSGIDSSPMIKPHILVVETDFVLLNVLARALQDCGCQVSKATHAAEAKMIINNGKVDMVVMECLLPDRSRIDLPEYATRRGLSVILMSGDPREIALFRNSLHPFLVKPFHIAKLLDIIRSVFGSTSIRRGSPVRAMIDHRQSVSIDPPVLSEALNPPRLR